MTLNTKIEVFVDFFADFALQNRLQERIVPQSVEIDKDKLQTKFLPLPKSGTPVKVVILLLFASVS